MRKAGQSTCRTPLRILQCFFLILISAAGLPSQVLSLDESVKITIDLTDGEPYDTVSGTVVGVDPDQTSVVVFARTNQWYIQPFGDNRAYLPISPGGAFATWIRDWRQISVFVVRKTFDALSAQQPHKPFPLSVDGVDVLAVAAHPSLHFSGYEWAIKGGDQLGPGNNYFSTDSENVRVDTLDRLHLKVSQRDGRWYCAEVYTLKPLGLGTYTFFLSSRVDLLDKNVVGSPFLYQDDEHELDVEFSRWGVEGDLNGQFVLQPWEMPGHREQFNLSLTENRSTHIIRWLPGTASFLSSTGHHRTPSAEQILHQWTYSGADVPSEGTDLAIHLNLWLLQGQTPSNGQEAEMVIDAVEWKPNIKGEIAVILWLLLLQD